MTETTKGTMTPSLEKPRVWVEGPEALGRPRVLVAEHDAERGQDDVPQAATRDN